MDNGSRNLVKSSPVYGEHSNVGSFEQSITLFMVIAGLYGLYVWIHCDFTAIAEGKFCM